MSFAVPLAVVSTFQSIDYTGPDSGSRTLMGTAAIIVVILACIGIGQMMTRKT
jgi:hypothetical protein